MQIFECRRNVAADIIGGVILLGVMLFLLLAPELTEFIPAWWIITGFALAGFILYHPYIVGKQRFELTEDGVLRCYRGQKLKEEFRLSECRVQVRLERSRRDSDSDKPPTESWVIRIHNGRKKYVCGLYSFGPHTGPLVRALRPYCNW